MYSNNIPNFQKFMTILNASTKKKAENLMNTPRILKKKINKLSFSYYEFISAGNSIRETNLLR